MKIRPVNHTVVVKPRSLREKVTNLLCGEVVVSHDPQFRVGEYVLFEEGDARYVTKDRIVLREYNVLAIIDEPHLELVTSRSSFGDAVTAASRRALREVETLPDVTDQDHDELPVLYRRDDEEESA